MVASGGIRPRAPLAKNITAMSVSSSDIMVGCPTGPKATPAPASHNESAMPADEICASAAPTNTMRRSTT
jgi:hypothetical protein